MDGDGEHGGEPSRQPRSPKRRAVAGGGASMQADHVPQTSIDVSSLTRAQSEQMQRQFHRAGIRFVMTTGTVTVPIRQADDAREVLAELSLQAPGDDTPVDDRPLHRGEIPGLGVPAERWRRLLGALVDGFVFALVALALSEVNVHSSAVWVVLGVISIAMVSFLGATPGKVALDTRVRDVATGRNPPVWRAALRWATPLAGGLVAVVVPGGAILLWIGYLCSAALILFSPDGRGVHDLVAGTIVVNSPSPR